MAKLAIALVLFFIIEIVIALFIPGVEHTGTVSFIDVNGTVTAGAGSADDTGNMGNILSLFGFGLVNPLGMPGWLALLLSIINWIIVIMSGYMLYCLIRGISP